MRRLMAVVPPHVEREQTANADWARPSAAAAITPLAGRFRSSRGGSRKNPRRRECPRRSAYVDGASDSGCAKRCGEAVRDSLPPIRREHRVDDGCRAPLVLPVLPRRPAKKIVNAHSGKRCGEGLADERSWASFAYECSRQIATAATLRSRTSSQRRSTSFWFERLKHVPWKIDRVRARSGDRPRRNPAGAALRRTGYRAGFDFDGRSR